VPPKDPQYDAVVTPNNPDRKPIIHEDRHNKNDVRNVYNPDKYNNHIGNYAQVNPAHPDGLVVPPKDPQYDAVVTPNNPDRKPIIHEDRHNKNDVRNVYNPDKYNNHIGNYAQVNPAHPDGLVVPPKDPQYDAVVTPNNPDRKPIIHEDRHNKNDVRNVYNPDKYNNHIGNYV
jgi:Asp-tRNA(Asn)/Glu-tRNA(Gln) amidotransferase A subunit family amidase